MSLTVIGAPLSPFVRKVHVTMLFKNIQFEMDPVSPFKLPPDYEKINPLKRIPVLKHNDTYIRDSAIICRYLEDLYPEPQLISGEPSLKAQTGWLEKLADYELAPAISATAFRHRVAYRSMNLPYNEEELAKLIIEKATPLYAYLDNEVGQKKFLVGDRLSTADIAVTSQFINAALGGWPNLARYVNTQFTSELFAPIISRSRKIVAKMLADAPH
jgi:glutathione S-transferase